MTIRQAKDLTLGWGNQSGIPEVEISTPVRVYSSYSSHNTDIQACGSALWHSKHTPCKSMQQLHINAHVYTVTSLLSSLTAGGRGEEQLFRTLVKLLYFYCLYIRSLWLGRDNGACLGTDRGQKACRHLAGFPCVVAGIPVCPSSELKAGRKDHNKYCFPYKQNMKFNWSLYWVASKFRLILFSKNHRVHTEE